MIDKYICAYKRASIDNNKTPTTITTANTIKNKNNNIDEGCVTKKCLTGKKKEKISCVWYTIFIDSGMFHSEEERNRTVDPLDKLQPSYGSTSATDGTRNPTDTFELCQITPSDFDSIGFDFDCDFRQRDSWGTSSSTCFSVGEPQCGTTFTSEDKWPI